MPTTAEAIAARQDLSFREKAGYRFGDAAANFVFQAMLIFQLGFYTDVFGIRMTASIYPAITFLIGVLALSFYGISRTLNMQIQNELSERRKSFETT